MQEPARPPQTGPRPPFQDSASAHEAAARNSPTFWCVDYSMALAAAPAAATCSPNAGGC